MAIKILNSLVLLFFIAQYLQVSCLETEVNEAFFIYQKWKNITEHFTSGATKGFLSYQELEDYLHQLRKNFPNVVLGIEPIGKTVEDRDIRAIHLSLKKKDSSEENSDKSAEEQKPSILFTGFLSGSDFISTAMIIYLTNHLLYENLHGNTDIQYLLQNRDIWMIPAINGDAYNFISNHFEEHNRTTVVTKNRKNNDPNGICGDFAIGVDLNRNFEAFFDGVDIISRVNGDYTKLQDYICKPFYRGTKAFSEPETLSIREFLSKHDFQLAINFVGKGNMFLIPYSYDTSLTNAELKEKVMYKTIEEECPFPPGVKFGSRYQMLEETNHGEISDYMLSKKNIIAGSYGLGVGDIGYEENLPTAVKARRILKENLDAAIYFIQKAGINFRIEELMQGRCQGSLPECPESDIASYVFRLRVSNTGLQKSEKTNLLISFGTNNVYDLQQVSVLDQDGNRKVTGLGIIIDESKKIFQITVPPLKPGSSIEVSPVLIKASSAGNEAVEDVPQSIIVKLKDYPTNKLSHYEGLILEPNFDINQANEQNYKRNMLITIALIVISCWIAFGGCGYALIKHFKGGKSATKFKKLHDESMQDAESSVKTAKNSDVRHRDVANEDERSDRRSKKRGGSKSKSKSKSGSRSRDEKKKAKEEEISGVKARKVPKDQSNGGKKK